MVHEGREEHQARTVSVTITVTKFALILPAHMISRFHKLLVKNRISRITPSFTDQSDHSHKPFRNDLFLARVDRR